MAGVAGMGTPESLRPSTAEELVAPPNVESLANVTLPAPTAQYAEAAPEAPETSGLADYAQGDFAAMGGTPAANPLDELFAKHGGASTEDLDTLFSQHAGEYDASPEQIAEAGKNTPKNRGFLSGALHALVNPVEAATEMAVPGDISPGTRAKVGLATTDWERRKVLEQTFGEDGVKKSRDGFLIKDEGKWKKFDLENFSLMNKVLEHSGDIIQAGTTIAGDVAVTMPLVASEVAAAGPTAGASLLALPGTIAAARAATGAAGQAAKDAAAALAGVPRDPSRSALAEYGTSAVLNATFGHVADWAGAKLAQRAAIQKHAPKMTPAQLYSMEMQFTHDAAKVLKDAGLYAEELSIIERVPGSPEAQAAFKKIANDPAVTEIFKLKADAYNGAVENWLKGVFNITGKEYKPQTGSLGSDIDAVTKAAKAAENKIIGTYRAEWLNQVGDIRMEVPTIGNKILTKVEELGISRKDVQLAIAKFKENGIQAKDMAFHVREFMETRLISKGYNPETAKQLMIMLPEVEAKILNGKGKLTGKQIANLYNDWSFATNNIFKGGNKQLQAVMADVRTAIRNEYTGKMQDALGLGDEYTSALSQWRGLEQAREQLAHFLDHNVVNTQALVKQIISKGPEGLDNLAAIKTVLQDRPDLYQEFTGAYYNQLLDKHFNTSTGKVAWNDVLKDIHKLGPDMSADLLGKNNMVVFNAFRTIGKNLEEAIKVGGFSEASQTAIMRNLTAAAHGSHFGTANALVDILHNLDKQGLLHQALTRDGMEVFLNKVPKSSQGLLKTVLDKFVNANLQVAKAQNQPAQYLGRKYAPEPAANVGAWIGEGLFPGERKK